MYLLTQIARYFVGILFVFSGLIKLNDPVGTQIKLEEYFDVFATDIPAMAGLFHGLIPLALYISVLLCVAEVILGVAVLIKYKMRTTLWILLLLIIFFTFLTFYSAYFNKVTDCGCFGDAIKLTPWSSFTKDVILLVLTLFLFSQKRHLATNTPSRTGNVVMGASLLGSVFVAVYAIVYMPPVDFLPYKQGANLPKLMQPSAKLEYAYKMEKDGKIVELTQYPTDTTYVFKEMVLLNPEAQPKVTDYAVWNSEGDHTQETFTGNKLLIIIQNVEKTNTEGVKKVNTLAKSLKGSNIEPVVLTAADEATFEAFRHEHQLAMPYYFADATVLKSMSRTNPGVLFMQNGTIVGKWPTASLPDAETIQTLAGGSKAAQK
ncbi:DoxX family protein [Rhodocytophaga aerolata]|uniref:DoxX family protein n=1 Tax=Rhodocytophaga aerolata TaxID=455078 RepID=A0ABT8R9E6_9BACT|nr:BT_3928 family protein [Rhodocytophaga aerolata]MDO1447387.1 DoxX family protein [Rhodocytophaga aerolata]